MFRLQSNTVPTRKISEGCDNGHTACAESSCTCLERLGALLRSHEKKVLPWCVVSDVCMDYPPQSCQTMSSILKHVGPEDGVRRMPA